MAEINVPSEKIRLKLTISYQGTNYHGWQIQKNQNPPNTIQGWLEWALSKITNQMIRVTASGRTDAGVHALGQIAHCDVPQKISKDSLRKSLNALLPKDIQILNIEEVPSNFHARFAATKKTYIYNFWTEPKFIIPFRSPFVWNSGSLNFKVMEQVLPNFLGLHDFASFQNQGTDTKTTKREILAVELIKKPLLEYFQPYSEEISFKVTATGFLKQMVRNLAGLLYFVGKDLVSSEEVKYILEAHSRTVKPFPTAPACGLTLVRVYYE